MAYSQKETNQIYETYVNAEDKEAAVNELSEQLGQSKKSIISKLAAMKIYQKPIRYTTKTGEIPVTKLELIYEIATILNEEPEKLEGIAKSSKLHLKHLKELIEAKIT